jgi:uncharacterized protein YbjT (DUF2867 family)
MEGTRRVLVLGATGFIGRRLIPALLEEGVRLSSLSRRAPASPIPGVENIIGDLLTGAGLAEALQEVDTAYYLVHSLAGGRGGFAERDRRAARNFVAAADAAGVRRVIYLGGLGEAGAELSPHLASRAEVARLLAQGHYALTVLRAAVIVGAGGASYEIIRALVKRLPVMIIPRWVDTRCQPIAVGDVIRYLVGCLDDRTAGDTFDIGGPEVLTYRQMMEVFARAAGEVNLYIPVPFLTPRLSSYWVGLVTPVKASIAMPLIEGLKNEVVCQNDRIRALIPFELTPYKEAVQLALAEEKNQSGVH